jgi:hypothetical protein
MASISSSNAVLALTQPILFPVPQQLQGFATDDVFDVEAIKSVETLMGVDGVLSAGFVFAEVPMNISLQADSASNRFFDTLWTQMQAAQDVYALTGTAVLQSIATKFLMINGFLTGYKPAPDVKRVLQPRRYQITWQRIFPQPS